MRIFTSLTFILSASIATAQPILPDESLSAAQMRLSALPAPSANEQFALGAVGFLRGIEKTLQFRWQRNMAIKDFDLPVLRLPVPPNPNARPFEAGMITELFENLRDDMAVSQAALDAVSGEVGVEIDLAALWFDINMNQQRDAGEGVVEFGLAAMMSRQQLLEMQAQGASPMLVRFDSADVAWLTAYTHLLSGLSEMVIAFDPTEAIARVLDTNQQMMDLMGSDRPTSRFNAMAGNWVDRFAMVYGALNQQPKAENTRAARRHFLAMIAQNKIFWAGVADETDNRREWIPNASQTAALGFTLPEGVAEAWQAILADGEKLLNGELLVSYWRLAPVGGVNIKALFEDPPVVDIVDWVQGAGLLPYLERGPTVSSQNLRRFERMLLGDAVLFALLFN